MAALQGPISFGKLQTSVGLTEKWATTCDYQQCGILTSVDSDEPVQPPFKLRNSKLCSVSSLTLKKSKRLAKALIRLHVCAGWSEVLLVALTTLLEIPCHGSNGISNSKTATGKFCHVQIILENSLDPDQAWQLIWIQTIWHADIFWKT